jgi:hypothetical protein
MKLLLMQLSPTSCYFISLWFKYYGVKDFAVAAILKNENRLFLL